MSSRLLMEAEAARDRLALADPVSAAGAMAQLLAAIRDQRVNDDAEISRARKLENQAARFMQKVAGLDDADCARLSGAPIVGPASTQPTYSVTG